MPKILPVYSKDELRQIRDLFTEYANSLEFDLSFQNFHKELEELPGEYAPQAGRLLLAVYDSEVVGFIVLMRISEEICEMK